MIINIIVVDDEKYAVYILEKIIKKIIEKAEVKPFLYSTEALAYAQSNRVDIAFLDIDMPEINGLILAKQLKEIYKETNIIFVTAFSEYTKNAMDLRASGYVVKPITEERVQDEINNLRNPVRIDDNGLRVQCFGNFEVFYNNKPVIFKRSKSKEIFAYLIDRKGASVSKRELAAILWSDDDYTRSKQFQLQTLITELIRALQEVNSEACIIKQRGTYAIDISKVNCDFYGYLNGDTASVNSYKGEYMSNYDWSEFTIAYLV